jgi:hypothetical protein
LPLSFLPLSPISFLLGNGSAAPGRRSETASSASTRTPYLILAEDPLPPGGIPFDEAATHSGEQSGPSVFLDSTSAFVPGSPPPARSEKSYRTSREVIAYWPNIRTFVVYSEAVCSHIPSTLE